MRTGTLKYWKTEKAFGFIRPDDGSDDVFVHRSGLVGFPDEPPPVGLAVEFDMGSGRDGRPCAISRGAGIAVTWMRVFLHRLALALAWARIA